MNTRQEQIVRDLENQFNQLNPIATGSSGLINVASIMSVVDASVNLKTEIELANKALIEGLQEQINADYERIKDDLDALGVAHALHKRGHVGELNQIRIGSKIGYLSGPYVYDPSITIEYTVVSVNEKIPSGHTVQRKSYNGLSLSGNVLTMVGFSKDKNFDDVVKSKTFIEQLIKTATTVKNK
jgi:hypothetical protein